MASTYSSRLRLELIGSGDQTGTWGNTTNTNLGTLLDAAIAGYTTVSVTSANQALAIANGAADEARSASIALTTTTTADFAVFVPPVSKPYIFYNSTAYTATVYCSTVAGNTTAAGVGVAIPAGKVVAVLSNGAAVLPQNTHLPVTTTTLTQPAGDNSTKIATTAYVDALVPTGEIKMWATGVLPAGYLFCLGQAVSRSTYSALFAVLGTVYGVGDGSTTFNVPNFSDRVPLGASGTHPVASTGGTADAVVVQHAHSVAITTDAQGAHTHAITDPGHTHGYTASATSPNNAAGALPDYIAVTAGTTASSTTGITVQSSASHTHSVTGATSTDGSSGTGMNLPPFLGIHFIIKT